MRDRYDTWFDHQTDYFLRNGWSNRPVFYLHNLDESRVGRIGTLLDDSFEFRAHGLYAVAQLLDNDLAGEAYEMIRTGRAAWSGGAMPNPNGTTFRVRKSDGYVERFALAEASVCPMEMAASPRGTTTIETLRAVYPDLPDEGEKTVFLLRAPWAFALSDDSPVGGAGAPATPPPPPAPAAVSDDGLRSIQTELAAQRRMLESLASPATRQPGTTPPAHQVSVRSQYDDDSWDMLNMLVHWRLSQAHALKTGSQVKPVTNEFMRALVDKARKSLDQPERTTPKLYYDPEHSVAPIPFRAVTPRVYDAWHARVPYLRADEAMQSDLSGYGDELLPTMLAETLYFFYRMDSRVLGLFNSIQLPSNPYNMPKVTGFPTVRFVNEIQHRSQFSIPTDPHPASKVATSTVTFTIRGFMGAMTLASRMLSHFANVDVVAMITESLRREMAYAIDYVLLNGDETESASNSGHGADPTGTNWDSLLLLNGLRELALTNSDTAATATLGSDSLATIAATMGTRGIMGLDVSNLAAIVDPGTQYKFNALADYETVYAVGAANATLLTGQVGAVKGIPVIPAQQLELADASGLYEATHAAGTKGQQVLVWRPGILVGRMGDVMLDVQQYMGNWMAYTDVALDLQIMEAGAVALGYNSTV